MSMTIGSWQILVLQMRQCNLMLSLETPFHEECHAAITLCGVFAPLCFDPASPLRLFPVCLR